MNNGLQFNLLTRDYVKNILFSLNHDYRNHIRFNNKKGILSKQVNLGNFDHTVSLIALNTFVNGKQDVYIYEKDKKNVISIQKRKEEKKIGKFIVRFPRNIMSSSVRKKLLKKVRKMDYSSLIEGCDYDEYPRDSLYVMNLIENDFARLTKNILSINSVTAKYTDVYFLYRELQKRKSQTILVNCIFDSINSNLHKCLHIEDKSDIIVFDCLSLKELDDIEQQLLSGNKSVKEISDILKNKPQDD